MLTETRTTDAKARLVLPKSFANVTVVTEQVSESEIRVRRARVVPEDEMPFSEELAVPLSDRDRDRFLNLLAHPPAPTPLSRRRRSATRPAVLEWIVEPFGKQHERAAFTRGKPPLDDFIRSRVSQYEKRRLGKTFVAVPKGAKNVLGYYTLAAGAISFEHLPTDASHKLPKHPVAVVLLARLAVDLPSHGMRLGEGLLLDALQRVLDLSAGLGVHAIEVDAIDDAGAKFYRKYGFTPLLDDPLHLYVPIATVEKLLV